VERVVVSHALPEPGEWCVSRLKDADDYFLSAYELWKEYESLAKEGHLNYEDFEKKLRFDERLYVTRGPSSPVSESHQKMLRQMGFPLRAMVALADRKPEREALDNAIYSKAVQLHQALLKLWNARPHGEVELENKLTRLLGETQKLCEALKPLDDKSGKKKIE
jgi:hypothetical protein